MLLVEEFINEDANSINVRDINGNTPLHLAVKRNNEELVRYLIKCDKVNLNIKNKAGDTPLKMARDFERTEIANIFSEQDKLNKKLVNAIRNKNKYLARKVIREGANVNAIYNDNGDTPLFLAYESGKEKALKILVEAGDNVNIKDKNGDTLLHLAIKTNNLKLLKCLVTLKGIDLNARDGYEDTPLLCAYKNGKKEALEILLKAGADMNMKDKDGNTILGEMRNQAILLCFGIFVVSLVVQFMILGVVSLESTIGEFSIPPLKTLVCIFVAVAAAVSIIGSSILYAGARSYIHFIKVEAEAEAGKFEPTDDNPPPYEA